MGGIIYGPELLSTSFLQYFIAKVPLGCSRAINSGKDVSWGEPGVDGARCSFDLSIALYFIETRAQERPLGNGCSPSD